MKQSIIVALVFFAFIIWCEIEHERYYKALMAVTNGIDKYLSETSG